MAMDSRCARVRAPTFLWAFSMCEMTVSRETLSAVAISPSVQLASAAPEPSTWLLMIVGIGGIGLRLRRAKTAAGRVAGALLA